MRRDWLGRGMGLEWTLLATVMLAGCGTSPESAQMEKPAADVEPSGTPAKLSAYRLFDGDPKDQRPAPGVIPYDLNSPLFTDYAEKFRFIKLPDGTSATYNGDEPPTFPEGTVIAKTFAYPADMRRPSQGRRLIETRILRREPEGWAAYPYVWNAEQTEAVLDVAGGTVDVAWIHFDGSKRTNNYIIPNTNQCKGCHKIGDALTPIGPRPRQLNRDYRYEDKVENQLEHWSKRGVLTGAPASAGVPRLAVWDDPTTGSVDARARAWLEINCAHCHSPEGPARNSGLDLRSTQQNPTSYGIFKPPVAAGIGSGGRSFDIVPGHPESSILTYRIASTHPGIMMPELGKRLVHEEGVRLVEEWIRGITPTH
jgi:uncharacterized repeat protein (TIGR03806 family)